MKKIYKLILLSIIFFIYWRWLSIYPHIASDLHFGFKEDLIELFNLPLTWGARAAVGMGEYAVFILWSWPINFMWGILARLGLTYEIISAIFINVIFIIFGLFSFNRLLSFYKISAWGKVIASILFYANTYILLLVDGGQINLAIAYILLPAVFVSYKLAIGSNASYEKIKFALFSITLSIFDIRIVYIFAILVLLDILHGFVTNRGDLFSNFRNYLSAFVLLVVGLIGFHAYWLIPAVFSKAPTLPETYSRVSQTAFLSFAKLGHSILLLQPHWFRNVFGNVVGLKPEFILIPVLVFLSPVLIKKSKTVSFWLLIALIGIFLVKGANPPLPSVYPWLFSNVPGFSLFRDPTKFFFLIALSYSVLIGFTVDGLMKKFVWKLEIRNWKFLPIPLLLSTYFLLLIHPVWLGQMTGTFSKPVYKGEFIEMAEELKKDSEFGRVFWIPTKAPLGYSSSNRPSVEAQRFVQERPFAIGTVGTYETFNFIREAQFMGELFDIAAIKYIVYPYPDTRREELKQDNIDYYYNFSEQINGLSWMGERMTQPPVQVFKTKKSQDHFFLAPKTYLVVGSDDIYKSLIKVENFQLSKNALIFSEEFPELGTYAGYTNSVILNGKTLTDFAATFIEKDKFIFPAEYLDFNPSTASATGGQAEQTGWLTSRGIGEGWLASRSFSEGWWKRETTDFIWWRDFLQQKYGIDNQDFDYQGGWAISEGNRKLQITNSKFQKEKILLARVMVSSRGGKVGFYQEDKLVGEIDTKYDKPGEVEIKLTGYGEIPNQYFEYEKADFLWFEVGNLTIDHQSLTIRTEGDINVVNSIVTIPEREWAPIKESVGSYDIHYWSEFANGNEKEMFYNGISAKVSYKRLSPTKYEVTVEGVDRPVTLAFSETYDSLWEANGEGSYPLYSLINGFYIEEDGVYTIYFSAQKYILPGLAVSIATVFALLISLLIVKKRTKI